MVAVPQSIDKRMSTFITHFSSEPCICQNSEHFLQDDAGIQKLLELIEKHAEKQREDEMQTGFLEGFVYRLDA